jgi:zinc transport system ATP-binding protein
MPIDILSLKKVSFRYNSSDVLKSISFSVSAGDNIGLVGPNGSGKTTLIKIILGLLEPSQGRIELFGKDIKSFSDWQRIGYLPQKISVLNPRFPATVNEIVAMGLLSQKRFPRYMNKADRRSIDAALDLLDIRSIKEEMIGELSGGQQQRTLVARAIVNNPDFLILDEPTSALDPETRDRFFMLLNHLNSERKISIIIVTHDIGTIGKYTTKLLYVDKEVIFYGNFEDFCRSPEITNFFGEHAQHIICHRH